MIQNLYIKFRQLSFCKHLCLNVIYLFYFKCVYFNSFLFLDPVKHEKRQPFTLLIFPFLFRFACFMVIHFLFFFLCLSSLFPYYIAFNMFAFKSILTSLSRKKDIFKKILFRISLFVFLSFFFLFYFNCGYFNHCTHSFYSSI